MGKFFGPKSWQETAGFCRVGWCLSSRRAKKAGIFQGRMSSRHGQWQSCVMVSSAVTQLASEKGPYPLLLCSCLLFLKGYDLSHSLSAPHLTPVPLLRPHTPSHISPHWCTNGQSELFSGFRPRCQAIWLCGDCPRKIGWELAVEFQPSLAVGIQILFQIALIPPSSVMVGHGCLLAGFQSSYWRRVHDFQPPKVTWSSET